MVVMPARASPVTQRKGRVHVRVRARTDGRGMPDRLHARAPRRPVPNSRVSVGRTRTSCSLAVEKICTTLPQKNMTRTNGFDKFLKTNFKI